MDKKKRIIELIKEDSWYNIPVEHTVDKIFSILGVSNCASVKSSGDFRDDDNRESQDEYYGRK